MIALDETADRAQSSWVRNQVAGDGRYERSGGPPRDASVWSFAMMTQDSLILTASIAWTAIVAGLLAYLALVL